MKTIECKMTLKPEAVKELLNAWLELGTKVALKLSKPVKDLGGTPLRMVELEGDEKVIADLLSRTLGENKNDC